MTDHYAILGVSRQATTAEIAKAYRQLLLREHKEGGGQADFGRYSLAYRTLTNHAKRMEYDRFLDELSGKYSIKDPESPTEAEKCYLAGQTCMEQKNFQDAVDYLYRAVQLEPENSHFCSQLGLALGMFKDRLAEAERYCKKAISLDPDNPDFRFNLGFLYQRHNLMDAAKTAFDLANEAISSRQARLLRQNEPLITPWGDEEQNLLDELYRLESMMESMDERAEPKDEAMVPMAAASTLPQVVDRASEPEPLAGPATALSEDFEERVTESDLLKQLADLESNISKSELSGLLATTSEQAEEPRLPIPGDDLLKELELLEAQVRGVEEFHNGALEKVVLGAAPMEEVAAAQSSKTEAPGILTSADEHGAPTGGVVSEPSLAAEEAAATSSLAGIEEAPKGLEPEAIVAAGQTTEETFNQVSLKTAEPIASEDQGTYMDRAKAILDVPDSGREAGIMLPASLAQELSAPEPVHPLQADAPPSEALPLYTVDSFTAESLETHLIAKAATSLDDQTGARPAADERQLPRGAAVEKLKMLDELEREILGELEMIRKEKERLQALA